MDRVAALENIRRIISLEFEDSADSYAEVERISLKTIADLKFSNVKIEDDLYHFLDDFDIRRKDQEYRKYQTEKVLGFL